MSIFLLDTNIMIYHLGNTLEIDSFFSDVKPISDKINYSFISNIELLSFPRLTIMEQNKIELLLSMFNKIAFNPEIEKLTIQIRRTKQLKIPDAIIAASAIYSKSTLVTRNTKDFNDIQKLKLLNPFE